MKSVFLIINFRSLWISALAVASTWFCIRYDLSAEFPLPLILIAVVFPIVFSIDAAYKRREAALDQYGDIKAHVQALYFAVRDWLDEPDEVVLCEARELMKGFLASTRRLFTEPVSQMRENEKSVYSKFSELSRFIKTGLRDRGLQSSEVSRCNQYLSKAMIGFERAKHIYQYRTPRTLNAFRSVFIVFLPLIYGPYFAFISREFSRAEMAYVTPVLISVVLASLDNIQTHLENPFDQDSEDDVSINVEAFFEKIS